MPVAATAVDFLDRQEHSDWRIAYVEELLSESEEEYGPKVAGNTSDSDEADVKQNSH